MELGVSDREGVDLIKGELEDILVDLRNRFEHDPGNRVMSTEEVQRFIWLELIDRFGTDSKIQVSTYKFIVNITPTAEAYDISSVDLIRNRMKEYIPGYWSEIKCLI